MPRHRWNAGLPLAALVLAVLVSGGLWQVTRQGGGVSALGDMVAIGGPFRLTTADGASLSDQDLAGRPFAVFFGFTHCPEVCPTTLWEMTGAMKTLGAEADRMKVLFISVDPTRDTPEFLKRYLQSFDPRIVGLTGGEAEIEAVGKAYRAYWRKVPTDDGDYTMDHTASIFLMDAKGRFTGTISYGEAMETRLAKLRRLIEGGTA